VDGVQDNGLDKRDVVPVLGLVQLSVIDGDLGQGGGRPQLD
jgi:hypothetical protein